MAARGPQAGADGLRKPSRGVARVVGPQAGKVIERSHSRGDPERTSVLLYHVLHFCSANSSSAFLGCG